MFKKVLQKIFNKENRAWIIGISALLFILILDIITKNLVNRYLEERVEVVVIPHLFNFLHIKNDGGAFGIGSNSPVGRIVFIVIPIVASGALTFAMFKFGKKSIVLSLSLGLMVAGAIGNVIDRLAFNGEVTDFIRFAFWDNFGIFNVADIGVVVGVVLFAVYIIFLYKDESKKDKNDKNSDDIDKTKEEEKIS